MGTMNYKNHIYGGGGGEDTSKILQTQNSKKVPSPIKTGINSKIKKQSLPHLVMKARKQTQKSTNKAHKIRIKAIFQRKTLNGTLYRKPRPSTSLIAKFKTNYKK